MELHKNSCWWLLSIFVISLLLYIASAISHPTISNVFLALFTGAFVSISVSLTNYFHIKKEFFNRLFFYGAIINKEFENIKQLTEYVNSNIDYKNVISLIIAHSEKINNHIHNIDFMTYSPFVGFLKEAEYVKNIGEMLSQYKLNLSIEILKIDLANRENEINILKNIIDENAAPEIINNLRYLDSLFR